ncbi:BCD family MFS transporter [Gloeobacter morelensis]|uniref:BCD family MFS transporter n=1 Tax=Gloeobacter morelensis MG652769 TaxID=2781736 RepID=A0ABY3PL30_9CYAN|nr:BCD family MFS transporter [Gloeobacter morelensis]UFP94332.1 BCD family MFS transporter [Gloeobacter morelensis MG652769]
MSSSDLSQLADGIPAEHTLPKLGLLTMFRLGLFQMGLGIMSILTLGVLNRILIDVNLLAIPATLAGGVLAMYQFVAPARVWFGQRSDARPLFGYHRTGYVWLGAALFCLTSYLAVQVIWTLSDSLRATGWSGATYGWVALLALAFAGYGLCISCSSTPFAALLVDVSDEDDRSKLVGIVWTMLMVGIVTGAITSANLLKGLTAETLRESINYLFTVVPAAVFSLALVALAGVEARYSRFSRRTVAVLREDRITLTSALRILTASRQTGVFFAFLLAMTVSLFMQQPILEPYGGEVFGMSVAESTRLNAFWGTGTLVGIPLAGFLIVPRLGKKRTARLGCLLVGACFGLVILAGFTAMPAVLQGAVTVLGLGFGITTNAAVSLMLDLTAAETAGTFIGAWGLAQAMSQAFATVAGGIVLDIARGVFGVPVLAYGTVFALESLGMLLAVWLLSRVDVEEFRSDTGRAVAKVLANEMDS